MIKKKTIIKFDAEDFNVHKFITLASNVNYYEILEQSVLK